MGSRAGTPAKRDLNRLHLGCGLITPPGWINVDGSWNARLAKHPVMRRVLHTLHLLPPDKLEVPWNSEVLIHDVRKPLPFPADSASAVYASHLLEHLYLQEGRQLIRECFRVLAEGGVLRVVVPDLHSIVREYLGERPFGELPKDFESLPPADRLNRRLLMWSPAPPAGNLLYRIYNSWRGFHSHKWMYDADSLIAELEAAGLVEVQQMELHKSRIDGIEQVEDPSRVLKGEGICVEGVKPRAGLSLAAPEKHLERQSTR